MNNKSSLGSVYVAIMGAAALVLGLLEFVGGEWGPLTVEGGLLTSWRAVILICAGIVYLTCVNNFMDIYQIAKAVVASVMIWIVAAMDIWRMIAAAIPSGATESGELWFASWSQVLAAFSPPYMPAIYLLVPSLLIIYFTIAKRAMT
ncbi:MAG: hypothetical protein ACOC6S_01520 [Chloroflexota bacterium]